LLMQVGDRSRGTGSRRHIARWNVAFWQISLKKSALGLAEAATWLCLLKSKPQ
jgi:hypothetical protein